MDQTLLYYNYRAEEFVNNTIAVDFTDTQSRFADKFNQGDYILDFGCGSGRDTKYFLEKGFTVDATDGSEELCKLASAYTGINVKCMLFQELDEYKKYDGIWACSSILHLAKGELKSVLAQMCQALKDSGYIYTSFKNSNFEGVRNGRYFTDFTIDSFREFIKDCDIEICEYWITGDVRAGREDEKWLNLILKKKSS